MSRKEAVKTVIDHNHTSGECKVGTRKEVTQLKKRIDSHITPGNCPRITYSTTCIHNKEQTKWQRKVTTELARYKKFNHNAHGSSPEYYGWGTLISVIEDMVKAGYYPWCEETRTHTANVHDLHSVLLAKIGHLGDVDSNSSQIWLKLSDVPRIPEDMRILFQAAIARSGLRRHWVQVTTQRYRPQYDPHIACSECDSILASGITCIEDEEPVRFRRYRCSCCRPREDINKIKRKKVRQNLKQIRSSNDLDLIQV